MAPIDVGSEVFEIILQPMKRVIKNEYLAIALSFCLIVAIGVGLSVGGYALIVLTK